MTFFFHNGSFPKGGNSFFIALIPKKSDANMVKDFRPISSIGSSYKIIAKILANRLVTVLGDIVNEVQSAFIVDRQILDGSFILNELVQWCKSKKKQSVIFKVDFEKAYDSVRWDYLDEIMKNFSFGEKWCGWIQGCLRSSKGSVIVNGSHTKEFQFHKGLKQGDPLSPFLFILVMMSLYISFQRVVDAGSKVGGSMSRIQSWNEIIDRVTARLSKWKMKTLSIGGKLTLLKSVLDSMLGLSKQSMELMENRLYELEAIKNVTVASKLSHTNLVSSFRRVPRGGVKQSQLDAMMDTLEGEFSVALVRKLIDDKTLPNILSKSRWIKAVPIKVNIHAWKVSAVESSRHTFFTCYIARDIFRKKVMHMEMAAVSYL
nr:RNA-directed DNA polymerase, eukaryota, reverse transcriptase zinc-binding domain protein [Tanacetum cinerariifolium]